MIRSLSDLDRATAPRRAREEAEVRALGERIGYGRVMQLAEQEWRRAAVANGTPGAELTVGACAGLLVPCPCPTPDANGHCDWCCGTKHVTERVAKAANTSKLRNLTIGSLSR